MAKLDGPMTGYGIEAIDAARTAESTGFGGPSIRMI